MHSKGRIRAKPSAPDFKPEGFRSKADVDDAIAAARDQPGQIIQEYLRNVAAIPGVNTAAVATAIPLCPGNAASLVWSANSKKPWRAGRRRGVTFAFFISTRKSRG